MKSRAMNNTPRITAIIDELPKPDDVERVRARLAQHGWPLDDSRDAEGGQ